MSKGTILIIDDNKSLCETLILTFEDKGFRTLCVYDAETGLEAIDKEHPHLILLDLRLPGMSGIEALEKIKAKYPEQLVIMMTAHDRMEDTIRAVQLGVYEYIHKPLDLDHIEMSINRAFQMKALSERMEGVVSEISSKYGLNRLVGKSTKMLEVFKEIGAATTNRVTVLITGESGTGKELIARAIHYNSPYKMFPFVALNCGAIPETLFESELFGYVKGAFTGADSDHPGKIESASEGTLFLDEISELPHQTQVKLLRVLQERTFNRVGSNREIDCKARIITATNRNLETMVAENKFREDLLYRLKVLDITVPPLSERREDISALTEFLLAKINNEFDKNIIKVENKVIDEFEKMDWPGNVRQLENVIRRAAVMAKSDTLMWGDIAPFVSDETFSPIPDEKEDDFKTLDEMEKDYLIKILNATEWNKSQACKILNISRPTLDRKIDKFSLKPQV
ncbi:MAG: sigma-54-dependent Fis family transcriptional regulator [candidate division Zixibacteria bacterium]|nr:sigma-54-dependent Fis family transcriptional regulator [candidate division Zixibacteria bacterium]